MRTAFYIASFLIFYGSAYPFIFSLDNTATALNAFLSSVWGHPSIGDILGNVALFIPFGFLGYLYYRQRGKKRCETLAAVVIGGLLLALVSQVVQLIIPSRDPALYDVYWNALGMAIGVGAARYEPLRSRILQHDSRLVFSTPMLLLVLWLSYRLAPFVPTIDLQAYKNAVKPLLLAPELSFSLLVLQTAGWMLYGIVLSMVFLQGKKRLLAVSSGVLVLALEVVIVDNLIALTDVAALGLAAACLVLIPQTKLFYKVLGLLLLVGWFFAAMAPFSLVVSEAALNWVPFSGFLGGSIIKGVIALALKVFVYAGAMWCLTRGGIQLRNSAMLVFVLVLITEFIQIFNLYHTADITDLIYVWFAYWLSKTAGKSSPVAEQRAAKTRASSAPLPDKTRQPVMPSDNALLSGIFWSGVVGAILAIACVSYFVVRLPGVPYNVREMFWLGGNSLDLIFFGAAWVWLGGAPVWAGRRAACSRMPWLWMWIAGLGVPVIFYLMLSNAITGETVADLAGSNTWSSFHGIENTLRFGALVAPFALFLALAYRLVFAYRTASKIELDHLVKILLVGALAALPLLFAARFVIFGLAVTDNLIELLSTDGLIGGGWAVLALYLLIAWTAAFAAHWLGTSRGAIKAVTVLLVSLPISWFLLNAALADVVMKGDLVFSPINFLLAPEKDSQLAQSILFMRWCALMAAAQSGLIGIGRLYLYTHSRGRVAKRVVQDATQPVVPAPVPHSDEILELNIHLDQLNFLTELGEARGDTLSGTLNAVIGRFGDGAQRKEQAAAIAMQLSKTAMATNKAEFTQTHVELTAENATLLNDVARILGMSPSRVLRRLVALFMAECRAG